MRTTVLLACIFFSATLNAQTFLPGSFVHNPYQSGSNFYNNDSSSQKKWFLTRYSALSTSYAIFKGGHATIVAAPIGLQLNRRLNNNLYAFANAAVVPAYVNFNRSFITADFNKGFANNNFFKSSSLGMYTSASLGLQYVNDQKTFSVSGSISVQRSNYPLPPYYRTERQPSSTNALNR